MAKEIKKGQLGADVIDGTKVEDDAIDSEHYADGSIDTGHIADEQVTAGKMADQMGQIWIPLTTFIDAETAAGTPLTLFVDADAELPGFSIADSEALGIRWNNKATLGGIMASVPMPQDLDSGADITIHYLASKTGATLADAVTWQSTIGWQTVGALHDADTPVVDTSDAMTGDATAKTVAELVATVANADIPASPSVMNISIQPTDGTLDTDDVILEGVWIEYERSPIAGT